MLKTIGLGLALAMWAGAAMAQGTGGSYVSGCSNCVTMGSGTVMTMSTCCTVSGPDEATLAAWAAKKAVAAQLTWYDEDKVKKLDREDLDALQARIDGICTWAKTLSNRIFGNAYAEWGILATSKLNERRKTLDQIDIAKSFITGLPTPPEAK